MKMSDAFKSKYLKATDLREGEQRELILGDVGLETKEIFPEPGEQSRDAVGKMVGVSGTPPHR